MGGTLGSYEPVDWYRLSQSVHISVAKAKNPMATPTMARDSR